MADDIQEFSESGDWLWHKPRGGRSVRFIVVGGGGSGGNMGAASPGSGGGGGGATYTGVAVPFSAFAARDDWPVHIGAGGRISVVWDYGADAPQHRAGDVNGDASGVLVGTDLYTSSWNGTDEDRFMKFDTVTQAWTVLPIWPGGATAGADLPRPVLSLVDGDIYALARPDNQQMCKYHIATQTWTTVWVADPSDSSGWGAVIPKQLWTNSYDSTSPYLGGASYYRRIVGIGDRLYVYGYVNPSPSDARLRDFWSWQPSTDTWTKMADAPDGLDQAAAQAAAGVRVRHNIGTLYMTDAGTDIFVMVYGQNGIKPSFWRYDTAANSWHVLAGPGSLDDNLNVADAALWDSSLCADGDHAFLIGGYNDYGTDQPWVFGYSRADDSWTQTFDIPGRRGGPITAVTGGHVWVIDGYPTDDYVHGTLVAQVNVLVIGPVVVAGGASSFFGVSADGGQPGASNGPPGGVGGNPGAAGGLTGLVGHTGGTGQSPINTDIGGPGGASGLQSLPLPTPTPPGWSDYWTSPTGVGGQGGGTSADAPTFLWYGNAWSLSFPAPTPPPTLSYDLPDHVPAGGYMLTIASSWMLADAAGVPGTLLQNGNDSAGSRPFSFAVYGQSVGPADSNRHIDITYPGAPTADGIVATVAIFGKVGILQNWDPATLAPGWDPTLPDTNVVVGGTYAGTPMNVSYSTLYHDGMDFTYAISDSPVLNLDTGGGWTVVTAGGGGNVLPRSVIGVRQHFSPGAGSLRWSIPAAVPSGLYGFGSFATSQFGGGGFGQDGGVLVVTSIGSNYLRMNQRDDGLGIARSPRLAGTPSNGPTSLQRGKPPRLGLNNTYR